MGTTPTSTAIASTNTRLLDHVNGDQRGDIVAFGNAGTHLSLGQTNGTFAAPKNVTAKSYGRLSAVGQYRPNGLNRPERSDSSTKPATNPKIKVTAAPWTGGRASCRAAEDLRSFGLGDGFEDDFVPEGLKFAGVVAGAAVVIDAGFVVVGPEICETLLVVAEQLPNDNQD